MEKENIYFSFASEVGSGSCLSSILGFPQVRRAFVCWTAIVDRYPLQYTFSSSFLVSRLVGCFLSHCDVPGTVLGTLKRTVTVFMLMQGEVVSKHRGIYIKMHSLQNKKSDVQTGHGKYYDTAFQIICIISP